MITLLMGFICMAFAGLLSIAGVLAKVDALMIIGQVWFVGGIVLCGLELKECPQHKCYVKDLYDGMPSARLSKVAAEKVKKK